MLLVSSGDAAQPCSSASARQPASHDSTPSVWAGDTRVRWLPSVLARHEPWRGRSSVGSGAEGARTPPVPAGQAASCCVEPGIGPPAAQGAVRGGGGRFK